MNDHMKYESKEIEKTLKELNYTTVLNSYTNESVPDILLFRWMREGRIVGKYISNGDLLATRILFYNMGNVPLSYLKLSDGKHAFLFTTFVDSFEIYYRSEKYAVASYGGDVVNGSDWQLYFGINPVDISYACIQKDFINSSGAVAYILQEVYGKGSNGEYFRGYIEI